MYPVTHDEIIGIAHTLKNKYSSGVDEIPDKLIKFAIPFMSKPLIYLCNLSLTDGIFTNCLKLSKVIPLHKKGNVNDVENFRPISLLSGISKKFERIMFNRVMKYLEVNSILSKHQHGFRRGSSTAKALHEFITKTLHAIDKNNLPIGVYFDLTKAFDIVNHEVLLEKLNKYGISGIANKWFHLYLQGRFELVEIPHFDSSTNLKLNFQSAKRSNEIWRPSGLDTPAPTF